MNPNLPSVEICLSPTLLPHYQVRNSIAVVIDVLRATTTMVAALAHGVEHILAYQDLAACQAMRNNGYLTAAERNGLQEAGFDLGNSPLAFTAGQYTGRRLAMTTTNGTVALKGSTEADHVLVAGFINLSATAGYIKNLLAENPKKQVLLVCSGWKGRPSAEDTLMAGLLAQRLGITQSVSDAVQMAISFALAANGQYAEFLGQCSHVLRLAGHGLEEDIAYCLSIDTVNIVAGQRPGRPEIVKL